MSVKIHIKSSRIVDFYKDHEKELEETSAILAEDFENNMMITLSNNEGAPCIQVVNESNNKEVFTLFSSLDTLEKETDEVYIEFIYGGFVSELYGIDDEIDERREDVKDALWGFLAEITGSSRALMIEEYGTYAETILEDIGSLLSEYYEIEMFYPSFSITGEIIEFPFKYEEVGV